jgi:hypothetical protein
MKHFHKDKTTIETLYHRDEEFQCLCADYRDGMKAKGYWCRSATENARMLCEEYKLLCTELEAEIEKWLREYDNR